MDDLELARVVEREITTHCGSAPINIARAIRAAVEVPLRAEIERLEDAIDCSGRSEETYRQLWQDREKERDGYKRRLTETVDKYDYLIAENDGLRAQLAEAERRLAPYLQPTPSEPITSADRRRAAIVPPAPEYDPDDVAFPRDDLRDRQRECYDKMYMHLRAQGQSCNASHKEAMHTAKTYNTRLAELDAALDQSERIACHTLTAANARIAELEAERNVWKRQAKRQFAWRQTLAKISTDHIARAASYSATIARLREVVPEDCGCDFSWPSQDYESKLIAIRAILYAKETPKP